MCYDKMQLEGARVQNKYGSAVNSHQISNG